jgi:hypothetical protein
VIDVENRDRTAGTGGPEIIRSSVSLVASLNAAEEQAQDRVDCGLALSRQRSGCIEQ